MKTHKARHSHIFFVRVWNEDRGCDAQELRWMVRNLHSGETRYFHNWTDLIAFIDSDVVGVEEGASEDGADDVES